MLYTVGTRKTYDLWAGKPDFHKLGMGTAGGKPYAGGIAFTTIRRAQSHLVNKKAAELYGVYGLDTDLSNTYVHTDGTRRLIKNCPIIPAK